MADKRLMGYIIKNLNEIIIAFAFAIVTAIILEYKLFRNQFPELLLSISLLAIAVIGIYNIYLKNIEALNGLYSFIGKSSSLKPDNILRPRPYNPYYYRRDADDLIDKCLNDKNNVLIIGSPLAGKTRALFQALNKLKKSQRIVIPICKDMNTETFALPKNTKIIVIDDLHRFIEQQNFDHLFRTAINGNVVIAATCRSKIEYTKVKNMMLEKNIPLETIFKFKNIIELPEVTEDVGKDIADKVMISWDTIKFDGNIGSIFMHFWEMEGRFRECIKVEKTILRAIKTLYDCGICYGNLFTLDYIKIAAKKDGLELRDYEWTYWFENLEDKEFITLEEKGVRAEEVYLENVVKLPVKIKNLDILKNTITIFSDVPDALSRLGRRAYDIGAFSLEKTEYMKIVITAHEEALKVRALDSYPNLYAHNQSHIGNAYSMLAGIENTNKKHKIVFEVYEHYICFGSECRILAEVEDKSENCRKAIKAYEEALKGFTLADSLYYAMTQNNLGAAYITLAGIEDKSENCKKAITACEEALKGFTPYKWPMYYAITQNNLWAAYRILAGIEDKSENCKKAITACEEALKVRTLDSYPRHYAMTQNNLGTAYRILAEVEDKSENCRKAIKAYEEALKGFTKEDFPKSFPLVEQNLRSLVASCQGEPNTTATRKPVL